MNVENFILEQRIFENEGKNLVVVFVFIFFFCLVGKEIEVLEFFFDVKSLKLKMCSFWYI